MFKNTVFNVSVDTKKWLKASGIRCVRTFASTFIALIPTTAATVGQVNWSTTFSGALLATIIIAFACIAGIPEVEEDK